MCKGFLKELFSSVNPTIDEIDDEFDEDEDFEEVDDISELIEEIYGDEIVGIDDLTDDE